MTATALELDFAPAALALAKPAEDARVLVHGVDWRAYVLLRELLDSPGMRLTYLAGALEIMTPSVRHETVKKMTARLLETFALELDVPLYGYGGATFKREAKARGLEPDECYTVGRAITSAEVEAPDIAIEIVLGNPLLDKLAVYRGLGVREVWVWQDGHFRVFALRGTGDAEPGNGPVYQEIAASELVPGLDFELLAAYAGRPDQPQAVREYRDRLRRA